MVSLQENNVIAIEILFLQYANIYCCKHEIVINSQRNSNCCWLSVANSCLSQISWKFCNELIT